MHKRVSFCWMQKQNFPHVFTLAIRRIFSVASTSRVDRQALFDALFGRAELCDGVEFLEGNLVAKWFLGPKKHATWWLGDPGDPWKWSMLLGDFGTTSLVLAEKTIALRLFLYYFGEFMKLHIQLNFKEKGMNIMRSFMLFIGLFVETLTWCRRRLHLWIKICWFSCDHFWKDQHMIPNYNHISILKYRDIWYIYITV